MFLPAGVAVLLLLAIVAAVLWLILRPQPERDAAAAQSWAAFHQYATTNGWLLLYVQTVYQHAHRGSKALVSIYGDTTSASRDAWFWWHQVQPGSERWTRVLGQWVKWGLLR